MPVLGTRVDVDEAAGEATRRARNRGNAHIGVEARSAGDLADGSEPGFEAGHAVVLAVQQGEAQAVHIGIIRSLQADHVELKRSLGQRHRGRERKRKRERDEENSSGHDVPFGEMK